MKNGQAEKIHFNTNHILVIVIAILCGCCNYYHVSTMFENDRHFSHLSNLEREMTFRTEMGLYYSYYKRIIKAQSFLSGLHNLVNDNKTEYPSTINTLQRFNLYPEIVLGASYRAYVKVADHFGIKTKECWQVDRGGGLPIVWSCEGLGDPSYFYINGVWVFAGMAAALIFVFGYFLSQSIIGGLLSAVCFFFNHGECTRVQWTPPLRESFGYPLILAQILTVSWCLRQKVPHWKHLLYVATTTACSLVTWQFSQFVFLTQAIALLGLWFLHPVPHPTITVVFLGKLVGLQNAVLLLFANEMLLTSFYTSTLVAILGCVLFVPTFSHRLESIWKKVGYLISHSVLIAAASYGLRTAVSSLLNTKDDLHILNLLKAKLTSFRDFHTMLYVCAAEFDFLPLSTIYKLSSTLLLPCAYLALGCVGLLSLGLPEKVPPSPTPKRQPNAFVSKKNRETRREMKEATANGKAVPQVKDPIDPAVVYNILQLAAFIAMAAMIMRLKLFMTPHLCIIASLIASRKYLFFVKSDVMHWALLAAIVSGMSYAGTRNISEQRSIIGEYSNPAFEDLINWIKREAPMDAAFAGPMPIMASILLTTERPIVNHPHYEDVRLRERTRNVYKAFGRGSVAELYKTLVDMKVTYLVLQDHWCFGEPSMLDVWDIEEPGKKSLAPLCDQLFDGNSSPLQRVFTNEIYVVLRVPSHYVEVKLPPRQYRQ